MPICTPTPLDEYRPFKYEQLTDLTRYLEKGDWGTATDATSGFHHLSLHPDMWEYAAFQAPDGQYYVFTVPAFGLVGGLSGMEGRSRGGIVLS